MSKHDAKESGVESGKTYSTLAVKYRPKLLKDLIGQDSSVNIIRGMMKKRQVPRTILIYGPYGTGKTTTAKLIARYLNCQHSGGPEECDGCSSCRTWKKDHHPDVHERDAGTMRGIDDVRELQKVAAFVPQHNYRVYIMDECHALTKDAWNAALKLFEEPPGKSMFVMCTTDAHKIPETIQSRSLLIKLDPIADELLAKLVRRVAEKEDKEIPKEAAQIIAEAAMGHPRNALSLLEQVLLTLENGELKAKDLEKQMPDIVRKVLGMPPDKLALQFVSALLGKDYEAAISSIKEVTNNAPVFMGMVIKLLTQCILSQTAHKQIDTRYSRFISSNASNLKKYWSPQRLGNLFELSLKTYERMKLYVVPEFESMFSYTLSAINLAR